MFSISNCFAQQKQILINDTTDSNSPLLKVQEINEIEVRSKISVSNIKSGSTGAIIDVSELKKLPNIMGDADPFKSLQYMGGISQAGDASANMNVRGGNNDQNLVLLNGCNIQNPTHVLGLFSVFNPDLIDQMKYIKTGIPAEYGGRLSSVIDIKNFTSIPQKVKVDGSVGLISSRISLKVPLSEHFSFYASHRGSYIGTFAIPLLVKFGINPRLAQNKFEFSDTNIGINYAITPSTKFSAHFYTGNDTISISQNEKYSIDDNKSKWGNRVLGCQLNHVFSETFSMAHYMNITEFYLQSKINWLTNTYSLNSKNNALSYKSEFVYLLNRHVLKVGGEVSFNETLPTKIIKSGIDSNAVAMPTLYKKNADLALYARDEWEYGNLLVNIGVRAGVNLHHPEFEWYVPNSNPNPKFYVGIEPRFFSRLMFDESSSSKLSISRHYQYFSRVPIVNFGVPLEIFVPTSATNKPSSLWHFSGGYFKNFNQNNWELSAEVYYKSFSNLLQFGGDFNDLFSETKMLDKMHSGIGWAYGTELMLKKNAGKFTGWVSYALGWNFRQFDDINQGKPFLATNDRRHDVSLIGLYKLNDKISFSATFVYATGGRLNLPRSWFIVDNKVILEYSKYNAFKMPDYNRLDISMNYKLKPFHKINSEVNVSIYNLYNRANPFEVYFSTTRENDNFNYKIKMSYLIPILPSISWTFHF